MTQNTHICTHNALIDHNGGNLGYEVHGPLVIDLLFESSHGEPYVPGVFLIPLLPGVSDLRQSYFTMFVASLMSPCP